MNATLIFFQVAERSPGFGSKLWGYSRTPANDPMKLLIVEDEARMADLLRKGLTEEGHTATCASDGAEGLALAKSYEFDVIILDVMMPKLS